MAKEELELKKEKLGADIVKPKKEEKTMHSLMSEIANESEAKKVKNINKDTVVEIVGLVPCTLKTKDKTYQWVSTLTDLERIEMPYHEFLDLYKVNKPAFKKGLLFIQNDDVLDTMPELKEISENLGYAYNLTWLENDKFIKNPSLVEASLMSIPKSLRALFRERFALKRQEDANFGKHSDLLKKIETILGFKEEDFVITEQHLKDKE